MIEMKMEKHNAKILGECSKKRCDPWELAGKWEVYHANWGLDLKVQECLYGLCEKLQLPGQAIWWDAG